MTTSFESHCARCGRQAPAVESGEYLQWESWNEPSLMVICPGCITSDDDELLDAGDVYPVSGMDGRAIDVAPAENELVRLSIDASTTIELTPAGARRLAAQLETAAGIAQPPG